MDLQVDAVQRVVGAVVRVEPADGEHDLGRHLADGAPSARPSTGSSRGASAAWWQRTSWPPPTSWATGNSSRHCSLASVQRGWKKQPSGRPPGSGAVPGIPITARLPSRSGTARSSRRVYGWRGGLEELVARAGLDDPPGVHDRDAVGQLGHDREVVAHVERGDGVAAAQVAHRLEHARLRGHVEAGRRLVADDHVRAGRRTPWRSPRAAAGRRRAGAGSARGTRRRTAARPPRAPRGCARRAGRRPTGRRAPRAPRSAGGAAAAPG